MINPPYVCSVNPHSKGTCARQHLDFVGSPCLLTFLLFSQRQPSVERRRGHAGMLQSLAPAFAFVPRLHVNQPLPLLGHRITQEDRIPVAPSVHLETQIGPAKRGAVYEGAGWHLPCHVRQHFGCGGGGECAPNGIGEGFLQRANGLEGGPEIVAPLADAVRFIDDDGSNIPMLAPCEKHGILQSLWAEVQKLGLAESGVVQDPIPVVSHPCFSSDAFGPESLALILHQGDQRRDHKAESSTGKGRQLETQTFPSARWHQGQGMLTTPQPKHGSRLVGAQLLEAPVHVKQLAERLGQAMGSFLVAHAVMTVGLPIFGPLT